MPSIAKKVRTSPGPGRPKDLEKRAAILDAAKRLFPIHGYEGVSMDAIAAEAGVSKLTVYSHFKDKDALFSETVRVKCEEQLPPEMFLADLKGPLRKQLRTIAQSFFRLIMSEEAISMHRMMHAQARQDSRLPRMFWEAGPQRLQDGFSAFLKAEVEAGQLDIPDLPRAASQFFCLLKGQPHALLMCGCAGPLSPRDADAHIDATIDFFLRAYQPAAR
jgi:TetR/AcrR family transcriptional regulator, mexJK operon transcriptional repressor